MSDRMPEAQRLRIDAAMLQSLSIWFRMRERGIMMPHSFNDGDVAEMLQRAAEIVEPKPRSEAP